VPVFKFALLARGVGFAPDLRVNTIVDIFPASGLVMVNKIPLTTTLVIVFWAEGSPSESFGWTVKVVGPSGDKFETPRIPTEMRPDGTVEGSAQVPFKVTTAGKYDLSIWFNNNKVWSRVVSIQPGVSPTSGTAPTIQ
jgi:hypothetical protein